MPNGVGVLSAVGVPVCKRTLVIAGVRIIVDIIVGAGVVVIKAIPDTVVVGVYRSGGANPIPEIPTSTRTIKITRETANRTSKTFLIVVY